MWSAQDELGAAVIDHVAREGVDDFHERGLDAVRVFDDGDGVQARLGRSGHAADHALMEVAEDLIAQGGRRAGNSVDFDVGAKTNTGVERHSNRTFRFFGFWVFGFRVRGGQIQIRKKYRSVA